MAQNANAEKKRGPGAGGRDGSENPKQKYPKNQNKKSKKQE
jgi:hypothetical protein